MSLTTDPKDPRLGHGVNKEPVPQNEVYLVLSDEERAKGFIRPVRQSYIHVGKKSEKKEGTLEALPDESCNRNRTGENMYVAYLRYPESIGQSLVGKYLTQADVDNLDSGNRFGGCGGLTTMNRTIAETYATNPKFYGATYCVHCQKHLPVEEFVWDGTNETVGS